MTELIDSFQPDWVSPPGDTIADLLEEKGWAQKEFAQRTGYTTKHVSLLINGKAPITEETAIKLERVLGSNARFWLTREAQYREAVARIQEYKELEKFSYWLKELPLYDMKKYKWITGYKQKGQQVAECLSFFGVASVATWQARYAEPIAAFKTSNKFKNNSYAVSAWLRQGERIASNIICREFNKNQFKDLLKQLRSLTNEPDPNVFVPYLVEECAKVGVAVVLEPAPKGCVVSGATKWLSPIKALLMLSLRHKTNDHLWFSFFHEAAHILLHGKKMLFLEFSGLDNTHEEEANKFARDLLIPPEHAKKLGLLKNTYADVKRFANDIGIAPAIVVGRMQNDGYLPWTHLHKFKVHYKWDCD